MPQPNFMHLLKIDIPYEPHEQLGEVLLKIDRPRETILMGILNAEQGDV